MSVWDWTTNGEAPMCSATLDDNFGKQVRVVVGILDYTESSTSEASMP